MIQKSILKFDKIDILVSNCKLKGMSTYLNCHLTTSININGDTGIVNGYIIVDNSSDIAMLMGPTNDTTEVFKSNAIYHVYDSIESNITLEISSIIFHNIYLTRYKSTDNVFFFMGKTTLKDLDKFLNKEVNYNG